MRPDEYPWEPPLAGTESEHLLGTLTRLRTTFRWKADGLDDAGLVHRIPSSTLTLGGLLKHLAADEDSMFTTKLTGEPIGEPWESLWPSGAEYHAFTLDPTGHSPDELYALWDGAVARSDARIAAALERGGLDQATALNDGEGHHASLRRLLLDLIEEYGRHTGHADLLREALDGRVGEDPPAGWRPVSGRSPIR
ncbi:DUF664 domain-containing protein [Occultella glacieicola]|uniref:DUF664 domain-containing protein n=1 Tax=Occultella glacieicola TaxID=2518684 RepID=A0ABY2E1Q6_9MICO|nr:DUF664 domain-containing protein [Occultella glacieicola]TDE92550.1 DUF664 domain-containing protein [Occultella glacieicola]